MKSLGNIIISILTIIILITIILFPKEMIRASTNGLLLWYKNVIPSLFIFMTGISILTFTGFSNIFGKIFKNIMKPLFNVSEECAFPWIMGILSGYPMGAKITSELYYEGIISKNDAQKTLSFSNNPAPIFIIGTISYTMLNSITSGYFILFIIFLSSISTGIIMRFINFNKNNNKYNLLINNKYKNIKYSTGDILKKSILSSVDTIVIIGGFIVLFSVIIETLEIWGIITLITDFLYEITGISKIYIKGIISGIFEMTYGCNIVSSTNINYFSKILGIILLISFGGISINAQTISILSKTDLNPFIYIISKIINCFFSLIYTIIFFNLFENYLKKTVPTISISSNSNFNYIFSVYISILLILILIKYLHIKISK